MLYLHTDTRFCAHAYVHFTRNSLNIYVYEQNILNEGLRRKSTHVFSSVEFFPIPAVCEVKETNTPEISTCLFNSLNYNKRNIQKYTVLSEKWNIVLHVFYKTLTFLNQDISNVISESNYSSRKRL